eukprot:11214068-Lingulodinium_polyedra.AAC.1
MRTATHARGHAPLKLHPRAAERATSLRPSVAAASNAVLCLRRMANQSRRGWRAAHPSAPSNTP